MRGWLWLSIMVAACGESAQPTPPPSPPPGPPPAAAPTVGEASAVTAKEPEPADASAAPPPRDRCGKGPWAMYAHDAARTSASDGCVEGALKISWSFAPRGPCGYKNANGRVRNAVADAEAAYASGDCAAAPAVWRVDSSGAPVWTMSRADVTRGSWAAIAGDKLVVADDGVYLLDRATGKYHSRELDVWGEPIADGDAYWVDNTMQLDGAGPFVGRFDGSLHWVWKSSRFDGAKGKDIANVGGIALASNVIVHAAAAGPRGAPTLSAYDAQTGDRKWTAKGTWPESAPSIADDRVYVLERWSGEKDDRLVARALGTGDIVWSQKLGWARGASPAVAPKVILVHARDGVTAFDRRNGDRVWSTSHPRVTPLVQSLTTLAVAQGSDTVVVTTGNRLAVLKLADGKEVWSDAVITGDGAIASNPIVVGHTVYVAVRTLMNMGSLVRLDPK